MSIRFYYDVVSPFSLLAFSVMKRYKSIWNVDVEYVPILLGGVMKASGNTPPGANPYKLKYLGKGKVSFKRLKVTRNE